MSATTRESYVLDAGDVSSRTFSFSSIDLLPTSVATAAQQIDVYHTAAGSVTETLLTVSTDYTIDGSTKIVTIDAGYSIAVGDTITIDRDTDRSDRYIDFTGLSYLDADANNNDSDNLLHLIQEVYTNVADALLKNTAGTAWNGQGLPSTNCGQATTSTGWVTYGQVVALLADADVADIGEGLYTEETGDGSQTEFELTDFPTTDINAAKVWVTIDGVTQRPGVDYTYSLNASSIPVVNFIAGAPPDDLVIGFRAIPGVVTTTYAAATLDGDVIIDNTLDGDAIIDGTLDGDALIDDSVPLSKLEFPDTAEDNRFIVVDSSETATLQTISNSNITSTGSIVRTDIDNTLIEVTTPGSALSGTPTYTNASSGTEFVIACIRVQTHGGNISLTPDGGSAEIIFAWNAPGGAVQDIPVSVLVPPAGVLTFTCSSGTLTRITAMEV